MYLTDPTQIRSMLAKKNGWLSLEEIAGGLHINARTVRRALDGESIRPHTARVFAEHLEKNVTDIITFR